MTKAPSVIAGIVKAITPNSIASKPRKTSDHQLSASNKVITCPFRSPHQSFKLRRRQRFTRWRHRVYLFRGATIEPPHRKPARLESACDCVAFPQLAPSLPERHSRI